MLFELSVGYFIMQYLLLDTFMWILILSIKPLCGEVHMDHWCIYWYKIIDKGNSIIILYPCINVACQAVEMMQSSKGQNQKVHSRWWQTATG